jgi:hypothetical protein
LKYEKTRIKSIQLQINNKEQGIYETILDCI